MHSYRSPAAALCESFSVLSGPGLFLRHLVRCEGRSFPQERSGSDNSGPGTHTQGETLEISADFATPPPLRHVGSRVAEGSLTFRA